MADPESVVRKFYDCYSNGNPDGFDELVGPDYADYGHTPPGRGPQGARDDYEHAVQQVGGTTTYVIDALVANEDSVAVAWTGTIPSGQQARGLSLYRVTGDLIRETRHTAIGALPPH